MACAYYLSASSMGIVGREKGKGEPEPEPEPEPQLDPEELLLIDDLDGRPGENEQRVRSFW